MKNLNEFNCTKSFNVKTIGIQYNYIIQAITSNDTKYYLAHENPNEPALYTKEDILEDLDLDAGDELAINNMYIDPEWSSGVLDEICVEYKEGKLKYLSEEMKTNIEYYINDIGYEDIYQSYIASKGGEYEIC